MSYIVWSPIWLLTWLFCNVDSLSPAAKLGFNDKFMSTRQQLTNTIYQNSAGQNNLEMNTSLLWSREFEIERSSLKIPFILKTSNYTIMLNNMDLSVFKDEDLQYRYTLESYFAFDVHFIEGFEWQGKIYILVCCQNSICNLYSAAPDFHFIFHQSISDSGDPTDAQFFVQQEKLYLAILFHERAFSHRFSRTNSQLRIYEWRNLYMDKDESIPDISSTATCIALFEYEEDIVIVLGCPDEESLKFPSQVWRRKSNGEMARVQYLPTDRPISINHFIERRENFIIIFENDRKTTIYWWEGSEFVQWLSDDGTEKYFQVAGISNLKNTALLSFVNHNVLRICLMTSVNLNKIYETEFLSGNMIEEILKVTIFEENDTPYMLVLTTSGSLVHLSLFKINIKFLDTIASEVTRSEVHQRDTAQEALENIYKAVDSLNLKLDSLNMLSSSVLLTNKNVTIRDAVVTGETQIKSGEIKKIIRTQMDIAIFIQKLYNYLPSITQDITSIRQKLQTTHISEDRHMIFHGKVIAKNAKINALNAQLINGNIFEPQSFLSITNPNQRLNKIKAKSVKVDWLVANKIGDKKVEDVQIADSRVKVPVTMAGLEGRNLRLSENTTINNITVKELMNKMVTVESEEDVSNRISQMGNGKLPRQELLKLQDNTVIENLYVDFIDDVPVHYTFATVFINGVTNTIDGDISFQAGVRTKEVAARKFDFSERQSRQYPPSEMNIPTPQHQMNIPPSQVNIPPPQMNIPQYQLHIPPPQMNIPQYQLHMPPPQMNIPQYQMNMPPPQMNIFPFQSPPRQVNIPPPQNIPTSQLNIPLLVQHLASQRLHSSNVQPPQRWIQFNPFLNGRRMKRDTMKKNEEFNDLMDDNEGPVRKVKVKIIGNLKVSRLLFRNSSLLVSNRSVPTSDLGETFWTSNTQQKINGSVHFSQGITIESGLENPIINGKNLSCYASRRSNFNSLIFENISINGNLSTEGNTTVWMPGQQASKFKVLNVKHLKTNYINGEKIGHILQTKDLLQGGMKIFTEHLVVDGNLDADQVNYMNLTQKLKSAVMTDSNFELNDVEFKTISGENLNVENIDNHSLEYLNHVLSRPNPVVHIKGDINLSQLSKVNSINGYPADFSKVVNNKIGATVYGKKKFPAQFTVTQELNITNINNVDFENFYKNILTLSGDQEVSGLYTIRNVEMKSKFNASSINGIALSNFVFINQPELELPSSVSLNSVEVVGNVNSRSLYGSCQLPKIEDEVVFEQRGMWSKVEIIGDSVWPRSQGGRIQHLFDSAVTSDGNQTITGNITIHQLSAPNVQVQSLNDKNISFIFQDSLSRQKEYQVISGKKTFQKSFKCTNIEVKGDAKVKYINNINLNDINDRLVRLSDNGIDIITGHKTFLNGFKAFSLLCPGGINGVKTEDLVSRSLGKEAPHFSVLSLQVYNSLHVDTINKLHLRDFLKDCIYLKCSEKQRILGKLHIKGNLFLHGNVTAPSINKISTNDIIFVNNRKPVRINGCKTFSSNVKIESNPKIHILNGRNLTETYRDNVKTHENVTINGSLVITSDVEVDTIFANEYFIGTKEIHLNRTLSP